MHTEQEGSGSCVTHGTWKQFTLRVWQKRKVYGGKGSETMFVTLFFCQSPKMHGGCIALKTSMWSEFTYALVFIDSCCTTGLDVVVDWLLQLLSDRCRQHKEP